MRKTLIIFLLIYTNIALAQINCNNWIKTPSVPSYVGIGQLNVPGNHITVEAVFNRTAPYSGGQVWAGDIVSKHGDPTDVNYLLRPNSGEITTTNGYYKTPDIADINLNQTYHVAMVYDGDTLKFYRNGCLMSKIAAKGDLFQNSWETRIGYYAAQLYPNENFIGYINEVRIWNVARTQAQIQTYMNSSLPNPTTQPGLLAYYTFDNLINKQGNAAWNGTLGGTATINETNPNCNAIINNCPVPPPPCNIIITKNADTTVCAGSSLKMFASGGGSYSWSPSTGLSNPNISNPIVSALATTKFYVTVSDASGCSKKDSVSITVKSSPLIAKSNDTTICFNSQVPLFASGGSSYVWSPLAGLSNATMANPTASPLTSTKYYVTVTNPAGCSKKDSVNITVNNLPLISKSNDTAICVNSKIPLFAEGGGSYAWSPATGLDNTNTSSPFATPLTTTKYYVTVTNTEGCKKIDSIKITVNNLPVISKSNDTSICLNAKVPLFASGGSSYEWFPSTGLNNANSQNPIAAPLSTTKYYITVANGGCAKKDSVKISVNNLPVVSKSNDTSICINSKVSLFSSGGTSYEWSPSAGLNNINTAAPTATPLTSTKYYVTVTNALGCSKMDSVKVTVNNLPVISKTNDTAICINSKIGLLASGGSSYSWEPAAGLDNSHIPNPQASPLVTTKYYLTVMNAAGCIKNDSVKIVVNNLPVISKSNDTSICFNTRADLVATGGIFYSWSPVSSLNNPTIPNPIAIPSGSTTYLVKVTNGNGCSKTDSVRVTIHPVSVITKSNDTTICGKGSAKLFVAGGSSYTWSPSATLTNASASSPVASPLATTMYYVNIIDKYACSYIDSVKVAIRPPAIFSISPPVSVCQNSPVQLLASGGDVYIWTPALFLNDVHLKNPVAKPDSSITYSVLIKENTCRDSTILVAKITVFPNPDIRASKSNDITCFQSATHLIATGANQYSWSPSIDLDNPNIANPTATPSSTTVYTVMGKDINGCSNSDTISVKVALDRNTFFGLPNSFTPNGDGLNDCFGVNSWGQVSQLEFSIYNRFGQRVFHTNNPADCWDGTFLGKQQNPDVYVYIIKATMACGKIDKKGMVTLLR